MCRTTTRMPSADCSHNQRAAQCKSQTTARTRTRGVQREGRNPEASRWCRLLVLGPFLLSLICSRDIVRLHHRLPHRPRVKLRWAQPCYKNILLMSGSWPGGQELAIMEHATEDTFCQWSGHLSRPECGSDTDKTLEGAVWLWFFHTAND